jgi:hypothetical protein
LIETFVPAYVEAVLLRAVQESVTAEHAARMVAMQAATTTTPKSFCGISASPITKLARPPSPRSFWKSSPAPKPSKANPRRQKLEIAREANRFGKKTEK